MDDATLAANGLTAGGAAGAGGAGASAEQMQAQQEQQEYVRLSGSTCMLAGREDARDGDR